MAVTVSARSVRSSSSAPAGSLRIRLRAASEVKAMPESRGPRPSWRSRRSRRRSSSRAVIVCPRDSCRSAARARARRVCASRGTVRRRTCSSSLEKVEVARPEPDDQLARRAVEQRRCGCGSWRVPDATSCRAVDPERGVRQDQRLTDRPKRQQRVVTDPAGDLAGGSERVGSGSEEELVDDAAQHDLQRLEGRRHQGTDEAAAPRPSAVGPPRPPGRRPT